MPEFTLDEVLNATLGNTEVSGNYKEFWGLPLIRGRLRRRAFLCPKGSNFDGHHFTHEAAKKSARGIVISDTIETNDLPDEVWVIRVDNTLKALQRLAEHNRRRFGTFVIAVTGSTGKPQQKT